jgi:hypothetical protein
MTDHLDCMTLSSLDTWPWGSGEGTGWSLRAEDTCHALSRLYHMGICLNCIEPQSYHT